MIDVKSVALTCAVVAFSGAAYADWSEAESNTGMYSYNQLGFSLAPNATASQVESDGVVVDFFGSKEVDEKIYIVGDLASGDYDDDVSRLLIGGGLGYRTLVMEGEGSFHTGIKLYHYREEVGRLDVDDTGYGLFAGFRHVYAGDILNMGINGIWEGFFNLEKQDVGHANGLSYDAGLRYYFDKQLSVDASVHFADDNIYGDASILDGGFLEQFAIGVQYDY